MTEFAYRLRRALGNGALARRVIRGGSWAVVGKAGATATGLVTSAVVTRLLDPSAVGIFYLSISIVTLSAFIGTTGFGRTAVRLLGQARGQEQQARVRPLLRTVLRLGIGAAFIVACLYMLLGWPLASQVFKSQTLHRVTPLVAAIILPFSVVRLLAELLRGLQVFAWAETLDDFVRGLAVSLGLVIVWLLYGRGSLVAALVVVLIASVLTATAAASVLSRHVRAYPENRRKISTGPIVRIAAPILFTLVLPVAFNHSTLWILAMLRSEAEVGLFGVVFRFAMLVAAPTLLYRQVVAPFASELYHSAGPDRVSQVERVARSAANVSFAVAACLVFALLLRTDDILGLVYGEFYKAGAGAVVVLALGQLANVAVGPSGQILLMTGHEKDFLRVAVFAAVLAIPTTIFLVARFGILGAAVGQALYSTLINVVVSWKAYARTGVKTWIGVIPRSLPPTSGQE